MSCVRGQRKVMSTGKSVMLLDRVYRDGRRTFSGLGVECLGTERWLESSFRKVKNASGRS